MPRTEAHSSFFPLSILCISPKQSLCLSSCLDFPNPTSDLPSKGNILLHNTAQSYHHRRRKKKKSNFWSQGFSPLNAGSRVSKRKIAENHERSRPATIQGFLRARLHDHPTPHIPSFTPPISNLTFSCGGGNLLLQSALHDDVARHFRFAVYRDFGGSDALRIGDVPYRPRIDAFGRWARLALLLRCARLQFV